MTNLQKQIRAKADAEGYTHIRVGRGSPANLNTIKALRSAGYICVRRGYEGTMEVWQVTAQH
jgi:hypothetical protein